MSRRWPVHVLLVAIGTFVCLPACETLYGRDSPRPALKDDDIFDVDPLCTDLPVDTSGVAAVPRMITMTGLRLRSGLGAESVPVDVRIGHCSEAPSCVGMLKRLEGLGVAAFELTPGSGCIQSSPSRLDCTLGPEGKASFGVVGHALANDLSLTGYLPLCVSPNQIDPQLDAAADAVRDTDIAVIPRFGASRVGLAAVPLDDTQPAPAVAEQAQCESLLHCNMLQPRARFQIGVVSSDLPAGSARREDFRQVNRDLDVEASLTSLELPANDLQPFLSVSPDCPPPDAGGMGNQGGAGGAASEGSELPLSIGRGQRSTDVFYLCAPGYASTYEITPILLDEATEAPVANRTEVTFEPWTERYFAEARNGVQVLLMQQCGKAPALATQESVPLQSRLSSDGTQIVIDCGEPDGSGGESGLAGASSGGAGAGGAPSAEPPAASSQCDPVTLQLIPEGTCTLTVGN